MYCKIRHKLFVLFFVLQIMEIITLGSNAVISFPAESELALMFVPMVLSRNAKEVKNAAARLSQRSIRSMGSQRTSP